MTIADIPVRVDRGHIQIDVARRVRAIDQHGGAGLVARRHHRLDRQQQRAGGSDVVQYRQPGPWPDRVAQPGQ